MNGLGLLMFPLAMAGIVLTGLPAFVVLTAVALLFAALGLVVGAFDGHLLQALPVRLIGLLEHDLLQALALYAMVGALLHRLRLAATWLATVSHWLRGSGAGSALATLGLGALAAPMNGSVGASAAMLQRAAAPQLLVLAPARATALLAAASTLGVIVPPTLVLVLLGDAMMRAHTESLLLSHAAVQVINNQDVMRAALAPGALLLALWLAWLLWTGWRGQREVQRTPTDRQADEPGDDGPGPTRSAVLSTLVLSAAVPALLAGVASGRLYAVEAAAAAGMALLLYGIVTGQLRGAWTELLDGAMRLTGMVFGLLVGATSFTLVLRGFGTDAWLGHWLRTSQAGPLQALLLVMALLLLCAFVLDAFELIFLVIPIVMPPLLSVVPDAAWVAAMTLLVLQIGYLLPPLGFAVMMARGALPVPPPQAALARALLPYLAGLLLVLGAVLLWPGLTQTGRGAAAAATPLLDNAAVEALMRQSVPREPDVPRH